MSPTGPYSELEYLVLAMVGEGVSSGYAIRKHMNRMRGGRWSAESGSVYRVLRRLETDGLLSESGRVGVPNRERTEYELTKAGEALVHSWLTFPPDGVELAQLVDPIRTRCYFITRLKSSERVRVVRTWINENKNFICALEKEIEENLGSDPITNMGFQNLMYLAQARHEWLKKLLTVVRGEGSSQCNLVAPSADLNTQLAEVR